MRTLSAVLGRPTEEHTYRELIGVSVGLADGSRLNISPTEDGAEVTLMRATATAYELWMPAETVSRWPILRIQFAPAVADVLNRPKQ
jgi:hypothetical protein